MNVQRAILFCLASAPLSLMATACDKAPAPPGAASAVSAPASPPSGAKLVLPPPTAGHAHLKGRITRGTAPAAGLKVEVCTTPQCGNMLQEKTDANGEYAFRDIDPGSYRLLSVYELGDATNKFLWPKESLHPIAAGAVETADGTMP